MREGLLWLCKFCDLKLNIDRLWSDVDRSPRSMLLLVLQVGVGSPSVSGGGGLNRRRSAEQRY